MKDKLKKKVLDGIRLVLLDDIPRKIESGETKPPVDMQATADGIWSEIMKNPMTSASVSLLGITIEDLMSVVREVLTELRVEVMG